MNITNPIYISKPTKEMVEFIDQRQREKALQMKKLCDKYRNLLGHQ